MKKSAFSGVMLVLFFGPFGLMYGNVGMALLFVALNLICLMTAGYSAGVAFALCFLLWLLEFGLVVDLVRKHNAEVETTMTSLARASGMPTAAEPNAQ